MSQSDRAQGRTTTRAERAVLSDSEPGSEDFEVFFGRESERLVRAMYLLTGDKLEAEDLSQEAMIRVFERWGTVSSMASPEGYLYRTAFNLHRRFARRVLRSGWARKDSEPISSLDSSAVARSDVQRALKALRRGERQIVVLRDWLGMSTAEIAAVLRVSPEAARVRLHRARAALRQILGDDYG